MTTDNYFDKYAELCQFEEGAPEYLIDKQDFKVAMLEYAKEILQLAAEKAETKCLNAESFGPNNMDYCSECEYHIVKKESILNLINELK